jgi:hypothetical protein
MLTGKFSPEYQNRYHNGNFKSYADVLSHIFQKVIRDFVFVWEFFYSE